MTVLFTAHPLPCGPTRSACRHRHGPRRRPVAHQRLRRHLLPLRPRTTASTSLADGASDAERRAVRARLSDELEFALRAVFDSDEFKSTSPKEPGPDLFKPRAPLTDHARFRPEKARIGVQWDLMRTTSTVSREIFMSAGPAMWLRVMPEFNPKKVWSANELMDHARSSTHRLLPFIQPRSTTCGTMMVSEFFVLAYPKGLKLALSPSLLKRAKSGASIRCYWA